MKGTLEEAVLQLQAENDRLGTYLGPSPVPVPLLCPFPVLSCFFLPRLALFCPVRSFLLYSFLDPCFPFYLEALTLSFSQLVPTIRTKYNSAPSALSSKTPSSSPWITTACL